MGSQLSASQATGIRIAQMEASSGLETEEQGDWLDFLPAENLGDPERQDVEGGGVMSELGRIFFQNSNLTVNLTPALIVLAVLLLVFIYPGLDAVLWFYFKFYGRLLRKFVNSASYSHDRIFSQWSDDKDWDGGDYEYEDVSSLLREYEEEFIPHRQQQQQQHQGFNRRNNKAQHLLGHRLSQLSDQDLALLN